MKEWYHTYITGQCWTESFGYFTQVYVSWIHLRKMSAKEHAVIHSPLSYSIAGTVGGLISVIVGHPLDTIKVRLQAMEILAQKRKFSGTLDCIMQTVRKEGAVALFKGLTPHMVMSVPSWSLLFWGYGMGLKLQSKDQNFDKLGSFEFFNAGLFSGSCVAAVFVPFFHVKCKLQVQQNF